MNAAINLDIPPVPPWDDTSYRGCELCDHGRSEADTSLHCHCSTVVAPLRWQSVTLVRAPHGRCGPEARYMSLGGVQL